MCVIAELKDGKKLKLEIKDKKLFDGKDTEHTGADINGVWVILDNQYKAIPYENFLIYLQSYDILE